MTKWILDEEGTYFNLELVEYVRAARRPSPSPDDKWEVEAVSRSSSYLLGVFKTKEEAIEAQKKFYEEHLK